MSRIQLDETSLPSIIEAQLTLSYSRLTKLIGEIVDQGNSHEDDIASLRERLARLEGENGTLRSQMSELLSKQNKTTSALGNDVASLREEVQQLQSGLTQCSEQSMRAAREQGHAIKTSTHDTFNQLQNQLLECRDHMAQQQDRLEQCEDFVHLWAADANMAKSLVSRDEDGATSSQDSVAEWATFLQNLPALAHFSDEIAVLRSLIQTQASEVIKTKMIAAAASANSSSNSHLMSEDGSRRSSNVLLGNRNRLVYAQEQQKQQQEKLEDMQQDITAAMRELQERVSAVENAQQQDLPHPAAMTSSESCNSKRSSVASHSSLESIQSRLTRLEGRLGAILKASLKRGRGSIADRTARDDKDNEDESRLCDEADAIATGSDDRNKDDPSRTRQTRNDSSSSSITAAGGGDQESSTVSISAAFDEGSEIVALADLDYRVKHLESVVDGLPTAMPQAPATDTAAVDSLPAASSSRKRESSSSAQHVNGGTNKHSGSQHVDSSSNTDSHESTSATAANDNSVYGSGGNVKDSARAELPMRNDGQSTSPPSSHQARSSAHTNSHPSGQPDNSSRLPTVPNARGSAVEHISDKEGDDLVMDSAGTSIAALSSSSSALPHLGGSRSGQSVAGTLPSKPPKYHRYGATDLLADDEGGSASASALSTSTPAHTQQVPQPRYVQQQQRHLSRGGGGVAGDASELSAVDLLRKQTSSQSLISPTPSVSGRYVSMHMEPEDGLCRRVTLVEENVAVLELNKADRTELSVMETNLREMIRRCECVTQEMCSLATGSSQLRRNDSVRNSNGSPVTTSNDYRASDMADNMDNNTNNARVARPSSHSRPSTSMRGRNSRGSTLVRMNSNQANLGRPLYVNSASVNLRDGSRLTSATVSLSTPL